MKEISGTRSIIYRLKTGKVMTSAGSIRKARLEALRKSTDGKIAREEEGVIVTDFDPERAPVAPKGYV